MIKDIQLKTIEDYYIAKSKEDDKPVTLEDLYDISRKLIAIDNTENIFDYDALSEYEIPDFDTFFNAFKLLNTDLKTLNTFYTELPDKIKLILFILKVSRYRFSSIVNSVKRRADALLLNLNSEDDKILLDWKKQCNVNESNVIINDNKIEMPFISRKINTSNINNSDISITVDADSIVDTSIVGDKSYIVSNEDSECFVMNVVTSEPERVRLDIEITIPESDINSISINMVYIPKSAICRGYIFSDSKWIEVGYAQVKDILQKFNFETKKVTKIRFEVYNESGDKLSNGNINYRYKINRVSFENVSSEPTAVWISNPLSFIQRPRKISFTEDSYKPDNYNIDYYIGKDDGSGNASEWAKVKPSSVNDNNTFILGGRNDKITGIVPPYITDDNEKRSKWNLTPNRDFGNPLYNILENIDTDNVSGNEITVPNIRTKSMKLYRGINDYKINYSNVLNIGSERLRRYKALKLKSTNSYEPIYLEFHIINEVARINPDNGYKLILEHQCSDIKKIEVIDDNGNDHTSNIVSTLNVFLDGFDYSKCVIEFADKLDTRRRYFVSYPVYIEDYEESTSNNINIDEDMTVISSSGEELKFGSDFYLRNGRLQIKSHVPGVAHVDVAFDYTIERKEPFRIFETYIIVPKEEVIYLKPFEEEEVKAGNFHRVNGIDISFRNEYVLSSGTHKLETTQALRNNPYNEKDVNDLTGKTCAAGIKIPENIEYRAFEKPLRITPIKQLGYNVKVDDHRTFAFHNNKVWLNKIPEYINPDLLNPFEMTDHITGKELLGKSLVVDSDNIFLTYLPKPEEFSIEYDTFDDIESETFFFKVHFTRNSNYEGGNLPVVYDVILTNEQGG